LFSENQRACCQIPAKGGFGKRLQLDFSHLAGKKQGEKAMAQQAVKKVTLKPLGNRVLVQRLEPEEKMKGGIILPDTAKKKQETAKVIAVGTGKRLDDGKMLPVSVKIGDVILMDKYSGQEVQIDDEEYMILKADDIIAIIEE
jgi:chaperonin GroES